MVAQDVVYSLCCEKDLCNQLLLEMVRDKLLEGVKMLVAMGADVNCMVEGETPICLAVRAQHREMVEYLLSKVGQCCEGEVCCVVCACECAAVRVKVRCAVWCVHVSVLQCG